MDAEVVQHVEGRRSARNTSAGARGPQPELDVAGEGAGRTVRASGPWTLLALGDRFSAMRKLLHRLGSDPGVQWDLTAIEVMDASAALLFWHGWRGRRPPRLELREEQQALFDQWSDLSLVPPEATRRKRVALTEWLAGGTSALAEHLRLGVSMLGQLVLDMVYLAAHPGEIPWREISATIHQAGTRALQITALVGILIGVVVSYLSSIQLRVLGAPGFIVNILGLSIVRELGPLLAALLVAGRSGSSMTAELGVMRVTQEVDALAVLGISRSIRLILPKVVALALVLPLLVVWTDLMALLGGMFAAYQSLEIHPFQFVTKLPEAVPVVNFWLGVGKGAVFGVLIALTACHFGQRIEPNTRSMGRQTTNAVVAAITEVILANAIFAVLFQEVGIA